MFETVKRNERLQDVLEAGNVVAISLIAIGMLVAAATGALFLLALASFLGGSALSIVLNKFPVQIIRCVPVTGAAPSAAGVHLRRAA
jgi:hypothetical protein